MQDIESAGRREATEISDLHGEPGAVKPSHVPDGPLGVQTLDQNPIGRCQHQASIYSEVAVKIYRFRRRAHNRHEQRYSLINIRATEQSHCIESPNAKIRYRKDQVRGHLGSTKCRAIIDLNADNGADAVCQQPSSVHGRRSFSFPQSARRHDAKIRNRRAASAAAEPRRRSYEDIGAARH